LSLAGGDGVFAIVIDRAQHYSNNTFIEKANNWHTVYRKNRTINKKTVKLIITTRRLTINDIMKTYKHIQENV